jgi:hypothetical protein
VSVVRVFVAAGKLVRQLRGVFALRSGKVTLGAGKIFLSERPVKSFTNHFNICSEVCIARPRTVAPNDLLGGERRARRLLHRRGDREKELKVKEECDAHTLQRAARRGMFHLVAFPAEKVPLPLRP